LNILVVALLLRRINGIRSVVPIVGAALFFLNRDTALTLGWAWSEGLLVFLGFLGFLWLDRYLKYRRLKDLILAGVFTSLAMLTRYSGVAFVLVGILAVLLFPSDQIRKVSRIRDALLFVGISCAPLALWSLRNILIVGQATGAGPGPAAVRSGEWRELYKIFYMWFMPGRVGEPARSYVMILSGLFLAGTGMALAKWTFRKEVALRDTALSGTLAFSFVILYSGVLMFSRLLVRFFPLDEPRHFVPLLPALLVALSAVGVILFHNRAPTGAEPRLARLYRWCLPIVLLGTIGYSALMVGSHFSRSVKWILKSGSEGMGYSNDSWRSSTLVEVVRSVPEDTPLFSNAYDALFLLTEREVYPLPSSKTEGSASQSGRLESEWQKMVELMQDSGALVVYFYRHTRKGMVTETGLNERLPLCPVLSAKEGRVYRLC
jgi:hypothetical protein